MPEMSIFGYNYYGNLTDNVCEGMSIYNMAKGYQASLAVIRIHRRTNQIVTSGHRIKNLRDTEGVFVVRVRRP